MSDTDDANIKQLIKLVSVNQASKQQESVQVRVATTSNTTNSGAVHDNMRNNVDELCLRFSNKARKCVQGCNNFSKM